MSPGTRARVVRAGCVLLGAMWIAAAVSKAAAPATAHEFAQRVAGGGERTKLALSALAGGEAFLGVAMVLGATRGLVATGLALAAATAALVRVKAAFGGAVKCGCLAILHDTSVDAAIVRNVALLVVVALLLVLSPRGPRAPAASGPARS